MWQLCVRKQKGHHWTVFDSPDNLKPRKCNLIFSLLKGRLPFKFGGRSRYKNATAKTRRSLPTTPLTDECQRTKEILALTAVDWFSEILEIFNGR